MRSKAPLALMEQLVMVLVFALSAALCVQVFVLSDRVSRRCEARDRAVLEAQNVAEVLRGAGGDMDAAAARYGGLPGSGSWVILYDGDWDIAADGYAYALTVERQPSQTDGLGRATITVTGEAAGELFRLQTAWQEVAGHG